MSDGGNDALSRARAGTFGLAHARASYDVTLDRVRRIRDAAQHGCTIPEIAAHARIPADTLREWVRRGVAGQPGYRAILQAVNHAKARKKRRAGEIIERAAQAGDWRAAARIQDAPDVDIEAAAFEGMDRSELIEWAASLPEVIEIVLARHGGNETREA